VTAPPTAPPTAHPIAGIPIVILNYNRADPLRKLVDWCKTLDGRGDIWIVDNASTYPGTLDFYDEVDSWPKVGPGAPRVRVVVSDQNRGHGTIPRFLSSLRGADAAQFRGRVVFTDPDLVPYPDTPNDVLRVACEVLDRNPSLVKVGPGLEVDDIPDCYFNVAWARFWEQHFWEAPMTSLRLSRMAPIDTTFALYRSASGYKATTWPAARLVRPRVLKHVDWYEDAYHPSEEFQYYVDHTPDVRSEEQMIPRPTGCSMYRRWRRDPEAYRKLAIKAVEKRDPKILFDSRGRGT